MEGQGRTYVKIPIYGGGDSAPVFSTPAAIPDAARYLPIPAALCFSARGAFEGTRP